METSICTSATWMLRYRPAGVDDPAEIDAINETLLERVNDSGLAYLTHTRLGGRYVIRFAIGQTATEWRHVAAAWKLLRETARGEN